MKSVNVKALKYGLFCLLLIIFNISLLSGSTATDYLETGIELLEEEWYYSAIDAFNNALDKNPYYGDAYLWIGEAYYALEEYEVSLKYALNALTYAHDDVDAMLLTANSYRELGEYDSAEEYYEDIQSQYPSNHEVYRNFGVLYLKMNKLTDAYTMLAKAERFEPDSWEVHVSLGDYYYIIGEEDEAEEEYQLAFSYNSRERNTYLKLSEFYYHTGEYEVAAELLVEGDELFNNFISGIQLLGDCYFKTGEYEDAVEQYEWLLDNDVYREDTPLSWLYYKLALCYQEVDEDEAVYYYEDALDTDDNNQLIRYSYEDFVVDNFKIDDSLREELSEYYYELSESDYARGDMEEYLYHLKRSVYLYPFSEDSRDSLVEYYEMEEDYFHAYDELETLFRLNSGYSVRDKIENYDWKIDNGKLVLEDNEVYEYEGLFVADDEYYDMSDIYTSMIIYFSGGYDKFKLSTTEYRKIEGVNSILAYVRNNDYNFFVVSEYDETGEAVTFELYDNAGDLIEEETMTLDLSDVEGNIFRFYEWLGEIMPDIGYVTEELANDNYDITIGSKNDLEAGDELFVFELASGELEEAGSFQVEDISLYSAECSVSESFISSREKFDEMMVLKSEYLIKKDLTKLKRILVY